jgi:hypothetical protein
MPFVQATCPNCGGIIEVDDSQEAWICKACGRPFIVEKAINNYNTTIQNTITVGDGGTVVVSDPNSVDARINNAEDYLSKLHDYKTAEKLFREIANDAGGDWRSWWGIVKSVTHNFERNFANDSIDSMNQFFNNTVGFVQNAANVAPAEMVDQMRSTWEAYQKSAIEQTRQSVIANYQAAFKKGDPSQINFIKLDYFKLNERKGYLDSVTNYGRMLISGMMTLETCQSREFLKRHEFICLQLMTKELTHTLACNPKVSSRIFGRQIILDYAETLNLGPSNVSDLMKVTNPLPLVFVAGRTAYMKPTESEDLVYTADIPITSEAMVWANKGKCPACGGSYPFFSDICVRCGRAKTGFW